MSIQKITKNYGSAKILTKLTAFILLFSSSFVFGGTFYSGATGAPVNDSELYSRMHEGQVLIVSEIHDNRAHHQNQMDILTKAAKSILSVSVGMEFFDYVDQQYIDDYTSGRLDENQFLQFIHWGGQPFEFYRSQVQFPSSVGGTTIGLNLPRAITGKVSQEGLDSLTEDEKKLLPPSFELGRDSYYERFRDVMKGHVSEEKIRKYFIAQSLWDDTMAWQASEFLRKNPNQLLMIIVGDFHVAYQDGLVARLHARGISDVLSVSQVDTLGYSQEDRDAIILPSAKFGPRSDFIYDVQ